VTAGAMIFGTPTPRDWLADLGATGVDEQSAMSSWLRQGPARDTFHRRSAPARRTRRLCLGTTGRIKIHSSWWKAAPMTLSVQGQPDQLIEVPTVRQWLQLRGREVGRCLSAGLTESAVMPLDETLATHAHAG